MEVVHEQHAHDWKPENAKMITQAALTKTREIDYVLARTTARRAARSRRSPKLASRAK
jgi:hypothetical protein